MRRPELPRYIPPPLRSKFSKAWEEKVEYAEDNHASAAANIQAYSLEKHDGSQRSSTDIVQREVRFDSSSFSSNPRHASDESYKDDDSSDLESYCDFVPTNHLKIIEETTKNNLDEYRQREERGWPTKYDDGIKLENYQTNANISNKILKEYTEYPDIKSSANQCLKFEPEESKLEKGLFYNYCDSDISEIEVLIDAYTKKGRVLTSTPISDIVDESVLEAAKYTPTEESAMESTLLGQNDTTINTNINDRDYNFEICSDSPTVKNKQTVYSEIIGGAYIPPPVPAPRSAVQWPIISRLPSYVLSSYELCRPHPVSPQHVSQWGSYHQPYPRHMLPTSQCPAIPRKIYIASPYTSSCIPPTAHRDLSSSLQPETSLHPNQPRMPSTIPPPCLPQGRFNPLPSSQNTFNPQHVPLRSANPPNSDVYKQDDPFFVPPPVLVPQLMSRSQQINRYSQPAGECAKPLSNSFINKVSFGGRLQFPNPRKER